MTKKSQYKPSNWSDYNKALIERGNINNWLNDADLKNWYCTTQIKGSGTTKIYSDNAIECISRLRFLLNLPLRAMQGFLEGLFKRSNIDLKVPSYTQICRRLKTITPKLKAVNLQPSAIDVAIDSTGLKVYGEGEWKVRQHGYSKRRVWRKLHLVVDTKSQGIVSTSLTSNDYKDNELLEDLLNEVDYSISHVFADGAYDAKNVYDYCLNNKMIPIVPPRKNARIKQHGNSKIPAVARDNHLRKIRKLGRKQWKIQSKYHSRSLSETAMYRFKVAFGGVLKSRCFDRQANESVIKCEMLNKFAKIGLAKTMAM